MLMIWQWGQEMIQGRLLVQFQHVAHHLLEKNSNPIQTRLINVWEVLKTQLTLNQKLWIVTTCSFSPCNFFIVNDINKVTFTLVQTTCYVISHFVSQTYNFNNTTKKKKGVITFNQQHGISFMKKHIFLNIQVLQVGGRMSIQLLLHKSSIR